MYSLLPLPFSSLPSSSFPFPSLLILSLSFHFIPFSSIPFPFFPFPSIPFRSLPSIPFPSFPFPSLPQPKIDGLFYTCWLVRFKPCAGKLAVPSYPQISIDKVLTRSNIQFFPFPPLNPTHIAATPPLHWLCGQRFKTRQ